MTTCREFVERLADLMGEPMPPETHTALERHLEDCPCCREYLDSYRLAAHLGRQLPLPPLPPRLARRLHAILDEGVG